MKKIFGIFIILFFGCIAVFDLLHPGFAVTHDGQDHIARIANFYMNLEQGVLIPRWAANLNWGYGHPILEFLYPLPSYLASFVHFLGFSLVDSTKIIFALAMVASGITMYLFVKKLWGEAAAIVSGVLYMYAPYRFVDLYVRGDIGEHVAFVFTPLVFLGMYLLIKKQSFKNLLFAVLSLACLILSHNAIALMITPLIILYGVFLLWQNKWNKKGILSLIVFFILGFALSGFFWIPALLEGQYTLRNIVTKGEYVTRFVSFMQLVYGSWNYGQSGMFTVQLGILQWIALLASVVFAFMNKTKDKKTAILVFGLAIVTAVSIFLMLPISNILWSHIMLLQNFQFPWRFLAIPVFTLSILGGYCVTKIQNSKARIILCIVVLLLTLFLSKDYFHARAYEQKPESFFTGIYDSTTDTGESSPVWSIRFMLQRFDKPLDVIAGNAKVAEEQRLITQHTYTVSSQGQSRLLENTLYFPGWRVVVDGKPVAVQFQDPAYRGLMTFYVGEGTHTVVVLYQESKMRFIGDLVSIIGIIGLGIFAVRQRMEKKK